MKTFLKIIFFFIIIGTKAQIQKSSGINGKDSLLIINNNLELIKKKTSQTAIFVDGFFMTVNTFKYLNLDAKEIITVNVEKKAITISSEVYEGQLHIITKNRKEYDFITLFEIKRNYTKSKNIKSIFIINDELIQDKSNTYKLDKNNILSVSIMDAENTESLSEQKVDFDVVTIKTKTPQNILKSKEIRIRGENKLSTTE